MVQKEEENVVSFQFHFIDSFTSSPPFIVIVVFLLNIQKEVEFNNLPLSCYPNDLNPHLSGSWSLKTGKRKSSSRVREGLF